MTVDLLDQHLPAGEDDVRQYLQEIRRYPRLTPEEERELARRCAEGDELAIRQMVNSNLRLVVSIAREYVGRGVPMMDLVQEGSIGLLAAAKKYDYTLEYRFSTYATKWIRQGITRCLMSHGLIRVPVYTAELIRKVQIAQKELLQNTGVQPTVEEIALACGMTEQKVLQLLRLDPEVCSLDVPTGDDDDGTLGELLENAQAAQPYETLVREELTQLIESMMGTLTERQRQVLRLRYGMEDGTCYSLEQIGSMLGISKERARQIEKEAVAKLKKLGAGMGLEDFLE
ncbi:MAG: sigma-70 family RNA polymerase sigma factor [Ruminococcaceae bacterium]|nr:sigma-70 family RNA polymerase sigma factor [Oscillospiraceae bacterium]